MMNCLNWCAQVENVEPVAGVLTKNQWQKLVIFRKSITIMTKQYEFKLQPFESVGFVTLMTHEQK